MSWWLLVLYAAVVLAAAAFLYSLYQLRTSPVYSLPGPASPATLVGQLLGHYRAIVDEPPLAPQLKWAKQYGGIFAYRLFFALRVFVTDPKAIQHVLVANQSNYVKPPRTRQFLADTVGQSVLTTEGDEHAQQRAAMTPAFHWIKMEQYVSVFARYTNRLKDKWLTQLADAKQQPSSSRPVTTVDLHQSLTSLTLDIIGITAFGFEFNSIANQKSELYDAYNTMFGGSGLSLAAIFPVLKRLPTASNRKLWAARRLVRSAVERIIASKHQHAASNVPSTQGFEDLLDLLLTAKDSENPNKPAFSNDSLTDQVLTFLLAGHETTSVGLCWALYLLSLNPSIQQTLRDELHRELKGRVDIVPSDLKSLPYLNATVHESLRMYPPAALILREAVKDDMLGDTPIPAGTPVFLSPYVLGRLPSLWKDPDTFRPERHINGSPHYEKEAPFSWLPFIAGGRACIGMRFAQLEMTTVLAILVQYFSFSLTPDQKIEPKLRVTLRPSPTIKVDITPVPIPSA